MLAYWHINHGRDARRTVSSAPSTYHDLQHIALLRLGVDPADVRAGPKPPQGFKAASAGPTVRKMGGGRLTEAERARGEQWGSANMRSDMAKHTGSDPKAVDWLFTHDAR